MNAKQQQALDEFKAKMMKQAELMMDVPMSFEIEQTGGSVLVFGSNVGNCTKWHQARRFVSVLIGPRGGVRILDDGDKLYR